MAGIEGVRIHDLRHSFASLAVSAGIPLHTIGQLLGHAHVATTQRYAHLTDGHLRDAVGTVGTMIEGKRSK
jgi:site-specific recombinase XerD